MSSYTCSYCGQYISTFDPDGNMNPDPAYHVLSCTGKTLHDEKMKNIMLEREILLKRIEELEKKKEK